MMTTRIKQELLGEVPGAGPGNTSFRCSPFRPTSGRSSARRIRKTRPRLPIVLWSSGAGDSVAKSGTPAASSARPPFHSPAGLERPRTLGLVSPWATNCSQACSAWRPIVHFPIAQRLILLAMPDRMRRFFSAILLPAVPSCRVARAQEGDLSSRAPPCQNEQARRSCLPQRPGSLTYRGAPSHAPAMAAPAAPKIAPTAHSRARCDAPPRSGRIPCRSRRRSTISLPATGRRRSATDASRKGSACLTTAPPRRRSA